MNVRKGLPVAGLAVLLLGTWLAVADITVCPKCGYENDSTRTECLHCRAALPAPTPQTKPTAVAGEQRLKDGKIEFLGGPTVEAEIAEGRQAFKDGDAELARLFLRNASALELLTDTKVENKRAADIAELLGKCDTAARAVRARCPDCNGTGKASMKATSLKGDTVSLDVAGKSCAKCGGSGFVYTPGTVDEQKFALGRALNRFATRQQIRKYVAVGGAWVPPDVADKLTVRQTVRLKMAMAAPCEACAGIGRVSCRSCSGTGLIKCTNRGCEAGKVTVTEGGQLGGKKVKRLDKCPVCNGTGSVVCTRCTGTGSLVCTRCNGNGERGLCRSCGGQGFIDCRRCHGTGQYKGEPCTACHGEAVAECTNCNGDGKER